MCLFWELLIVECLSFLRLIHFERSSLQSKQHTLPLFFLSWVGGFHKANGQVMSKRASLAHNSVGTVQSKYIKILYP